MATPLRKDEPQFGDEEITTADLAQGKRPASETRGPQPVLGERNVEQALSPRVEQVSTEQASQQVFRGNDGAQLFPQSELEGLRSRWQGIQTGFVDEPRKAVQDADGLVASAMKRLAEVFAEERAGLERQWDRGENVSTEDLRVALQRYRAFFERLLAV